MTGTVTTPGPFDALEKARPDEPMFPLLARDPDAPATITEWCRLRRNRAYRLYGNSKRAADKKMFDAELQQCNQAETVAQQMTDWRGVATVDEPGQRASYQDVKKSAEEIAEAEEREHREKMIRHLRECAYHLSETRDGTADRNMVGAATVAGMDSTLLWINRLADNLTVVRPGIEPQLPIEGEAA